MIADIVLKDDDQGREYHLTVHCRVLPELGGAPGYCVDLDQVFIDSCVVWFDKQGSEVPFYGDERIAAQRFVESKYPKEIEALCLEKFLAEKAEAA